MSEQSDELQKRTRQFALDVIELVKTMPDTEPAASIKRQLTKAGTGVATNHRELTAIFSAMTGTARFNERRHRHR